MSRRVLTALLCHFCAERLFRIEPVKDDPGGLYCYGCRESKNAAGYGHKDDLAQGLRRGELPRDVPVEVLEKRRKERQTHEADALENPLNFEVISGRDSRLEP